ncbi:DUF1573 domain-containing protein [Candidatus Binatus sp.]|uniref:DUF1573 domain-containing protein n=1 Tax=Candidatus Binatus sp. TaxID=2811406 RepID=UPI00272C6315|nr:DUF1573 domain-containing protein [Candidatus Binatus sp.]
MRRIFLALAIGLLIAGTTRAEQSINPNIPGGNSAPPGREPKAVVDTSLYDFGTALEGKQITHTFRIKNAGRGYLDIRGVKTSCGCTTGTPTKTHIAPGDESEIAVMFDTHFQKGHQVRTITASTNDPNNPQVPMTMQGTVKQQVAATPAEVAFGSVRKGAEATREIVIDDLVGGSTAFKVGPVSNSSSSIKVVQEKRTDGKPGAMLKITLLKTMPVGTFDDSIKVTTNRVPLNVDVFGTVSGDLNIDPAQVSFGIVPRGQDIVRIIKLSNEGSRNVKVLDVSSSTPTVVASAEPVKSGKEYKLTVTLKRGTPEGQLHGNLTIKTDDPEQSTLAVPFYAIVGQFKS